jgi:hypothetical protein
MAEDDSLKAEIERLSAQFGVGLILLDLEDVDSSRVYLPARHKLNLDWESINKLSQSNPDFLEFLGNIKIDFNGRKMHAHEYDEGVEDMESHLGSRGMFSKPQHRLAVGRRK